MSLQLAVHPEGANHQCIRRDGLESLRRNDGFRLHSRAKRFDSKSRCCGSKLATGTTVQDASGYNADFSAAKQRDLERTSSGIMSPVAQNQYTSRIGKYLQHRSAGLGIRRHLGCTV